MMDYRKRIETLLDACQVDIVAIVSGANMVYFTGLHFHLSERPTLAFLHRGGVTFILPQLEQTKLTGRDDLQAQVFAWSDTDGYQGAFVAAADALNVAHKTLGVDGQTMRVFEWLALGGVGVELARTQDVGRTLLQVRAIKTPEEVATMREAIRISEQALANVCAWVRVGMTEREIATRLAQELSALGSEGQAFEPIVLAGEKSALPHGVSGGRVLGENEYLLIDFGGMYHEYPADITRTFYTGTPSDKMREIYDVVAQANAAARAVARAGVTCGEVDAAARKVIEAAGYGAYFTHRTGHGLGLQGHELPQIASGVDTPLEVGMVFTIEPGVYLEGFGGVRIEDDVVVTADGIDVLTSYPREFVRLG